MTTPAPSVNPYAAADAPRTGPNSLAKASFVIAIVLVVIAIIMQVVTRFIPLIMNDFDMGTVEIGVLFGALGFLDLLLGGLGFVLGLLGARRGDALLQAGIGIGVGGSVAVTALFSLISAPLTALIY
jgi:hypothetical protein